MLLLLLKRAYLKMMLKKLKNNLKKLVTLNNAKKKQKMIEVKEIKLSVKIAQNDINYKVKHAREFLEAGKHVKFRVFLRGREMANPEAGVAVLERVWPMVEDIAMRDKPPKLEGRYVNMLVVPKQAK